MTTPSTYSMETRSLTPTEAASASNPSVTASASLMVNYRPCMPVSSQVGIKAIENSNGDPIIFSVSDEGQLFAVKRDTEQNTGWLQFDLSTAIEPDLNVLAFDALNLTDDHFVLAVSFGDGTTQRTYITPPLSNRPNGVDWDEFAQYWVARPTEIDIRDVSKLVLGYSDLPGVPIALMMASVDGDVYDRYVVSGVSVTDDDETAVGDGSAFWHQMPLVGNAFSEDGSEAILSVKLGICPQTKCVGTYTLYQNGPERVLGFDSICPHNGQVVSKVFTNLPEGASSIATLTRRDEKERAADRYHVHYAPPPSEVFVATQNCLYQYPATSDCYDIEPSFITAGFSTGTCTDMVALSEGNTSHLWLLSESTTDQEQAAGPTVLEYLERNLQTEGLAIWSTPMPIRSDVTEISVARNRRRRCNEVYFVDSQKRLSFAFQDSTTTLWQETQVPLSDTGTVEEVQSYTTVLHFAEDENKPMTSPIKLSATSLVNVNVNGYLCMLGPDTWVDVHPDAFGAVTIIAEITTAATGLLTVRSPLFSEYIDVNPMAIIAENLPAFTDPDTVRTATFQNSDDLILPNEDTITAEEVAEAMQQLLDACNAAGLATLSLRGAQDTPANVVDPDKLSANAAEKKQRAFGVSNYGTPNAKMHYGVNAFHLLPPSDPNSTAMMKTEDDGLFSNLGNVWNAITSGIKTVAAWVFNIVEKGLEFVVHLVEGTVTFLLDTFEKVFQVLFWLADEMGMALGAFTRWLGQLMGFGDMFNVQNAMKNGINAMFVQVQDGIEQIQQKCDTAIESIADYLNLDLPSAEAHDPYLTAAEKTALKLGVKTAVKTAKICLTPLYLFPSFHLNFSMSGGGETGFPVAQDVSDMIEDFVDLVADLGSIFVDTCSDVLGDVVNGLRDGSLSAQNAISTLRNTIGAVFNDIASGVLGATKTVIDAFCEIVQDLFTAVQDLLAREIEIPFFSGFYRALTGNESGLLECMSFALSIPVATAMSLTGARSSIEALSPIATTDMQSDQFSLALHDTASTKKSSGAQAKVESSADSVLVSDAWKVTQEWIVLTCETLSYGTSFIRAGLKFGSHQSAIAGAIGLVLATASSASSSVDTDHPAAPIEALSWIAGACWMPINFFDIIGSFTKETELGKEIVSSAEAAGVGVVGLTMVLDTSSFGVNVNGTNDDDTIAMLLARWFGSMAGNTGSLVAAFAEFDKEVESKEIMAVLSSVFFLMRIGIDAGFAITASVDIDLLELDF